MAENDQERTEQATEQRREDFRKRGQVAQTKELATVMALFTAAMLFTMMGRYFFEQISSVFRMSFGPFLIDAAKGGDYVPAVMYAFQKGSLIVAPLAGMLTLVGVASTVLQTGLLNNEDALELNWGKLDPIDGLRRVFSLRNVIEGLKSILKILAVGAVMLMMVKDQIIKVPTVLQLDVNQIFLFMGDLSIRLFGSVGVFMGVIAAADYFIQRWQLEQQMRMTKQEVKEEHKSREGDPLIKARIRRVQRELANKRMMSDVPKADVVITNPTHIAIAIQYDPQKMASPKVVAKGAGLIAEKIKALAREHNIPVMENKPLARTIFKTLKIGQSIPRELFTAVAQVLSYVYKLKKRKF
jgi:flagellar biosynthetic protein FlhB